MKRSFAVLVSGFLIIISSCSNSGTNEQHKESGNQTNKPHLTKAEDILIDFKTWYNYTNYNIHLSRDFIGLDIDSGKINKTRFLDRLTTGKFVPLKIKDENNLPTYKLYALNNNDPDITSTISQMALNEILHFRMEGKELPDYDFIDLNGKTYDRITTRGKVLVIKCWFIRCVACVKEFSELNKLVDKYKDRNDILFISLAIDSKKDLISFLNTKEFKYAVVPDKEKYMSEQLSITAYPTHILIDKNGKIVKVVNGIDDLIPFIEKQTDKPLVE